MRVLALSAVLLNAVVMPVGADEFDTDLDGMPDSWETTYGLTVGLDDSADDLDADGLNNGSEYSYGTNPTNGDTDGDTRGDGLEVTLYGTDPAISEVADMDITDIFINPTTSVIGYTAVNNGNVSVDYTLEAGYTAVYIHLGESDESTFYYDWATEMGSGSWSGDFFTAGGSETINAGVGLISGEYNVMVCIERAATYGEVASGLDNCEQETFQVGPDLTVTDISFVETGTPGQYYVYADLANLGDIEVDTTTLGSVTTTLNSTSEKVYSWSTLSSSLLGFLSANGSTLDFESYGARPTLVDGDTFQVCVDSTDAVTELNEENNCLTATFDDGLDPDLIVDSVSFDATDGSVDFVVTNQGTADVDSSATPSLAFYYDFYNPDLSSSYNVNYSINDYGTEYKTVGGSTSITSGPAGDAFPSCVLYVLAVADSTGDVLESDDLNNEYRTVLDLCPDDGIDETSFNVYAGDDQTVEVGDEISLLGYVSGASTLSSATIDWGDGSSVEDLTQTDVGSVFELTGSHIYLIDGTYNVTICASDEAESMCDNAIVTVTPVPFGESGTSSTNSQGGGASNSDNDDEDVTLSGEDDQTAECSEMTFEDVTIGDDFYDAVCEFWAMDVIHGKMANFFDTDDVIRRDEASKIFTRWFGYITEAYGETPSVEESSFVDVSVEDPLVYYIEEANAENIVTGEGAYFNPHDAITVEEIKSALDQILGTEDSEAFTDVLDESGFESEDTMTRGSFVEFLFKIGQ